MACVLQFDNIFKLEGVPVITVQLRYDGWVTELQDPEKVRELKEPQGLNNLLYRSADNTKGILSCLDAPWKFLTCLAFLSADADFSCFADLALTSPVDYYKEGEGSLMQVVITPADPYMPMENDAIASKMNDQVIFSNIALYVCYAVGHLGAG